jgi:DNA invertase Pin-like site-specific DNA recombinase
MIVGIYSRLIEENESVLFSQIEDGLKFMLSNGYNGCKVYSEKVPDEFTDISERIVLNQLAYDVEIGNIDTVYVNDVKLFSSITVKVLQVLISFQDAGVNVHHKHGCIYSDEQYLKLLKQQLEENWKRINEISNGIDFGG